MLPSIAEGTVYRNFDELESEWVALPANHLLSMSGWQSDFPTAVKSAYPNLLEQLRAQYNMLVTLGLTPLYYCISPALETSSSPHPGSRPKPAPWFKMKRNSQNNQDTHPWSVETVFPNGLSSTSGFGGTGSYIGTYRNFDEIASAWAEVSDNEVPPMGSMVSGGGYGADYPHALKRVYYQDVLPTLRRQYDELVAAGRAPA